MEGEKTELMKLSESGRLSLSDIAAATIGNLAEVSAQWDSDILLDNNLAVVDESVSSTECVNTSESVNTFDNVLAKHAPGNDNLTVISPCSSTNTAVDPSGMPVLRPWEDNSGKVQNMPAVTVPQTEYRLPPSYQESMKRKIGQLDQDISAAEEKRLRMEPDSTVPSYPRLPALHSSLSTTSQSTAPSNVSVSDTSSALGDFLTSLQQASIPISSSTTESPSSSKRNISTKSITNQSETSTNRLSNAVSDFYKGTSLFSSDSAQSYLPLLQPPPLPPLYRAPPSYPIKPKLEYNSPAMIRPTGSIRSYQHNTMSSQIGTHVQDQESVTDYSMYGTVQSAPSNSISVSSTSPFTYIKPRPSSTNDIKLEPMTPDSKAARLHGNYDNSPAMDSRFTESLSSLLGSPPPDSPLSKNPFFGDLQDLLTNECKREIIPQSLFGMNPKQQTQPKIENVFTRERNLQERFTSLQTSHPDEIRQLSSVFRYQSALIETERFRTLHECQYPGTYKDSVNGYYDDKLHKVMDRVERSVCLLENAEKENKPKSKVPKPRPHLSKAGVRLMEHWYNENMDHPYPNSMTIDLLAQTGNIEVEQVKKWFANKRNRNQNTRSLTEIAIQKRRLGHLTANKQF